MPDRNPHTHAESAAEAARGNLDIFDGKVVDVDKASHAVAVRPSERDIILPCDVAVTARGDAHLPPEGSNVLVLRREDGRHTVVGIRYDIGDDIPTTDGRLIAHGDNDIHLKDDGNITITNGNGVTLTLDENGINVNSGELTFDGTTFSINDELVFDGSTLTLNGGSNGVVTDVTTNTDADGHVTSISVERSNTIQL